MGIHKQVVMVVHIQAVMVCTEASRNQQSDCMQVQLVKGFIEENHRAVAGKVVVRTLLTLLVQATFDNTAALTSRNRVDLHFGGNIEAEVDQRNLQEPFEDSDTLQDFVQTAAMASHSSFMEQ